MKKKIIAWCMLILAVACGTASVIYGVKLFVGYVSVFDRVGSLWSSISLILYGFLAEFFYDTFKYLRYGPQQPDTIFQDFDEEDQSSWYPTQKGGE